MQFKHEEMEKGLWDGYGEYSWPDGKLYKEN